MVPAPVGHQCPECVAQARTEFRKGPGRRIMVANAKGVSATKALLAILLAVFVIEVIVGGPGSFMSGPNNEQLVKLGASVAVWPTSTGYIGVALGEYWRLFTAMFLHIGLLHIAFNGYALWIFGTMVEGFLGRWKFLLLYLLTGVCASAVSYAWSPVLVQGGSTSPSRRPAPRGPSSVCSACSSPTRGSGGAPPWAPRSCGWRSCSS